MCLLLLTHHTAFLERLILVYADTGKVFGLCYSVSSRTSNVLPKPLLKLLLEEEGNEIAINFFVHQ